MTGFSKIYKILINGFLSKILGKWYPKLHKIQTTWKILKIYDWLDFALVAEVGSVRQLRVIKSTYRVLLQRRLDGIILEAKKKSNLLEL